MGDESFAVTTLSDDSTVATGCFRDTAVFGPDGINEIELVSDGLNDIFIARFAP